MHDMSMSPLANNSSNSEICVIAFPRTKQSSCRIRYGSPYTLPFLVPSRLFAQGAACSWAWESRIQVSHAEELVIAKSMPININTSYTLSIGWIHQWPLLAASCMPVLCSVWSFSTSTASARSKVPASGLQRRFCLAVMPAHSHLFPPTNHQAR